MRNPKSQTTRKFRSRITVLPSQARKRACPSKIQNPASRTEPPASDPLPAINHPLSTINQRRTSKGKVARLPYAVRDMINRMLRNNIPHSQIVDALDELQFKLTERNISNWKTRGGYRDWCIAQDRALETRLLQDNLLENLRKNDASQLAEVGLQLAATGLSQFFLKSETRQQLNAAPEKLARTIGILCRLARQIHILQKYRDQSAKELGSEHNPEQVKRQTDETLESIRDTYSAEKPGESIKEPHIPHRNLLPKNGYPATPPEEDTQFEQNFQMLRKFFPTQDAEKQTPPGPGSATNNDSPAEPKQSDDSAPALPNSPTP